MPAARPRVPRYGKAYYPKTYKAWIDTANRIVDEVTSQLCIPLKATTLFAIPRAKTSQLIVPVGDGDNYEKAIYDLLTKKGYLSDDKWIVTGTWRKRFLPFGAKGYTLISLTEETEDVDITK